MPCLKAFLEVIEVNLILQIELIGMSMRKLGYSLPSISQFNLLYLLTLSLSLSTLQKLANNHRRLPAIELI